MKSQYIIIITIITALTASMLFLAFIEKNQREKNEDFWSIYFVYPFTDKNDFVIDNRSGDATFHYEVHSNDALIKTDAIQIDKNTRKLIRTSEKEYISPITIIITRDGEEKIIEKK